MHRFSIATVLFAVFVSGSACETTPPPRKVIPAHMRETGALVPGEIHIDVSGISRISGQLYVELYDKDGFFEYDRVLNERIVAVDGLSMRVTLENVPPGRYIATASHDANANNKLDTNWFGLPTEVYGFSRGARGSFGPPDFEDGAFDFDGTAIDAAILME